MCLYCTVSDSKLCNSLYPLCWLVGGSSPSDLVFYWRNIAFIIREWWIPFFEIRKWRLGMSWEFGELHSSLRLEPGVVMWGKINERERMTQYSHTSHLSHFLLASCAQQEKSHGEILTGQQETDPSLSQGSPSPRLLISYCHMGWNSLN